MKKGKRTFRAPDGTTWGLDVRARGASNAMVVFRHPDPRTSRLNRYAWFLSHSPEARDGMDVEVRYVDDEGPGAQ